MTPGERSGYYCVGTATDPYGREFDMDIRWRGKAVRASALAAVMCGIMLAASAPAEAGPCTADISRLQAQIKLAASNPVVGPSTTQTVGAQLHHQPTPGAVEHAETQANADADAAFARARKADEQGDATSCREALRQARLLYGLAKN
jgi:hypothetical protein